MYTWSIKYRGRDDLTEETVAADEFIDNGEWVDFIRDEAQSGQHKVLRVRASDVVEIRAVSTD